MRRKFTVRLSYDGQVKEMHNVESIRDVGNNVEVYEDGCSQPALFARRLVTYIDVSWVR